MIDLVLAMPMAFVAVASTYLVIVTLAAFAFRSPPSSDVSPLRFALVVPAHNEEYHIEETTKALLALDYPRDRFHVFVIADNCDDETAKRARLAGAIVLERSVPGQRGKGQALDWCFRSWEKLAEEFEAVAIVDADSTLSPSFLREMSSSLSRPHVHATQGRYAVSNESDNWHTALVSAAFTLIGHVRSAGRDSLGGSCALLGNGMAFRSELLARYGWAAHSIVEDLEFSLYLALRGDTGHIQSECRGLHRCANGPHACVISTAALGIREAQDRLRLHTAASATPLPAFFLALSVDFARPYGASPIPIGHAPFRPLHSLIRNRFTVAAPHVSVRPGSGNPCHYRPLLEPCFDAGLALSLRVPVIFVVEDLHLRTDTLLAEADGLGAHLPSRRPEGPPSQEVRTWLKARQM